MVTIFWKTSIKRLNILQIFLIDYEKNKKKLKIEKLFIFSKRVSEDITAGKRNEERKSRRFMKDGKKNFFVNKKNNLTLYYIKINTYQKFKYFRHVNLNHVNQYITYTINIFALVVLINWM